MNAAACAYASVSASHGARTIMVTGTTGQLGRALLRSLDGLGHVVAVDRAALDLEDPARIRETVRALQPSLIVNPAAYTAVDQAEADPARAFRVNARAPGVLAQEAARLEVPLIHYSTDYIYDGEKATGYDEGDPPHPQNVYGRSKLAGEEAIRESHCRHLILRTSWVYDMQGQNFMRTMLRLGAAGDVVRVVGDQFGAPTWAQVIADISAGIVVQGLAAQNVCRGANTGVSGAQEPDWWRAVSGVYHVSAGGETTWADFARAIFSYAGLACRVEPIPTSAYPTPARRPAHSLLSNDKLARAFGLVAPHWRTSLQHCLASGHSVTSPATPPAAPTL